jgi:hypothetical protein
LKIFGAIMPHGVGSGKAREIPPRFPLSGMIGEMP